MLGTCLIVIVLPGFAIAAPEAAESELQQEFTRTIHQLDAMKGQADVDRVLAFAGEIEKSWPPRSMEQYGKLIEYICGFLRSEFPYEQIPFGEISALAGRAIATYDPARDDNITVQSHYMLLMALQSEVHYTRGELSDVEWLAERRTGAERWLVLLRRVDQAIDPDWDPDAPLGIHPVNSNGGPFGIAPESIQDPKARTEYEAAIADHQRRIAAHGAQRKLRDVKHEILPHLLDYLCAAYALPPDADAELEALLKEYIDDPELRAQILDAVAAGKAQAP